MKIADQLKKKRMELGLSQEQVANKVGISRRTLSYYESGDRIPNAEILLLLCEIYSLDINKLVSCGIKNKEGETTLDSYNVISKIDEYLRMEQAKKESFSKGMFYASIIITAVVMCILALLVTLRFILMFRYNFSFSDATAKMWTSLFESLIEFVNDPTIKILPLLSIFIASCFALGWGIYFIVKAIKKKNS